MEIYVFFILMYYLNSSKSVMRSCEGTFLKMHVLYSHL